jgi:hypothetical protein
MLLLSARSTGRRARTLQPVPSLAATRPSQHHGFLRQSSWCERRSAREPSRRGRDSTRCGQATPSQTQPEMQCWSRLRGSKRVEAPSGDALGGDCRCLSLHGWLPAQGRDLVQARDVAPVAARLRRVSWIPSGAKGGLSPTGVPCAAAQRRAAMGRRQGASQAVMRVAPRRLNNCSSAVAAGARGSVLSIYLRAGTRRTGPRRCASTAQRWRYGPVRTSAGLTALERRRPRICHGG